MASPGAQDDITAVDFSRALRGYDPAEVRAYLADLAERVEALQRQHATALASLAEYGERDRSEQIDELTADINRILHAAQSAAEKLTARTEAETVELCLSAERQANETVATAEADAYALRKDAWEMAAKLLDDVVSHVADVRKQADAEALEIIGEAERTAHRRLAAARRDAENQLRVARLEGERIRVDAQGERDELLENARLASEAAQERTRALEKRRDELLADIERLQLEGVRDAPGDVASTTVRVVRNHEPGVETAAEESSDAVRIIGPPASARWADGTENVRLVQPPSKDDVEFLDGDSIADEVRRLRDAGEAESTAEDGAAAPPVPTGPQPDAVPPPVDQQADEDSPEETPAVEPAPAEVDLTDGMDATLLAGSESAGAPGDDQLVAGQETPVSDEETAEIDDLFSQLRRSRPDQPHRPPPVVEIVSDRVAPEDMGTEVSEETPLEDLVPPEPVDPLEIRDRLLLPITNRVLRAVKRQLSDGQNVALEGLRLDPDGWSPQSDEFVATIGPDCSILESEAFGAGAAAAAELLGSNNPRPKAVGLDGNAAARLAQMLEDQVVEALDEGRRAGHNVRDLSATVSRVYRAWRTDHAEREIRSTATAAYHQGMRAAYAEAGVDKLRLVIAGAGCVDCRAAAEHLVDPSDPAGPLPPLHERCSCTVVHN